MKRRQFDLRVAESNYAVANVPLFLLHKLQSDAAVQAIANTLSADEILAELKDALKIKPSSLREVVEPYVLLLAFSRKAIPAEVKKAAQIPAPFHDWFSYLAEVIATTAIGTKISSLVLPGQMPASLTTNTSDAITTRTTILRP